MYTLVGVIDMEATVEFLSKLLDEKTRENERLRQTVKSLKADNDKLIEEKDDLLEECMRLRHQVAECEKREEGRVCMYM